MASWPGPGNGARRWCASQLTPEKLPARGGQWLQLIAATGFSWSWQAITAAARAFDDRAGSDGRINQKFARTNLERLTKEFIDQLCQDTGGPCTYTGLSMKKAHTNMGVTNGEFDAFMDDLVAVLDDFKVGKAEQEELLNLLRPMRADIVEVDSSQVGTPLPPAFAPAPPL